MTATATTGSPHNHLACGRGASCTSREPLTLADLELIHGRPFIVHDQTRDYHEQWCERCLADLPLGFAALFHVCTA